jgi:non-canonical (house-cleaning) NTP pyrophosphatase
LPEAPIRVAVGSLRAPKLAAVRAALEACARFVGAAAGFELVGFDVPSGVRSTPLTRAETMQGARNRVEELRALAASRGESFHYYLGLEGGLDVATVGDERHVFLESWVYVVQSTAAGYYGQSGAITLPEELARQVVDEGVDLSDAIDAYAGRQGIRNGLGAWGVLTGGLITREDAFRIATINALAPFFRRPAGQIALS